MENYLSPVPRTFASSNQFAL